MSVGFYNITLFWFFSYLFCFLGWFLLQGSVIWFLHCHLLFMWFYSASRFYINWILNIYSSLDFSELRLLHPELLPAQLGCLSDILYNLSKSEFLINPPQPVPSTVITVSPNGDPSIPVTLDENLFFLTSLFLKLYNGFNGKFLWLSFKSIFIIFFSFKMKF